jgi:hypothetical protein
MAVEVDLRGATVIPFSGSTALATVTPPTSAPPAKIVRNVGALSTVVGVGFCMYLGALVMALGVAGLGLTVAAVYALRRAMRQSLAAHLAQREKWERRRRRERKLEDAGVSREELAELTILSDEIERRDPGLAARYDVDAILDRHVEFTLAHERCLRAMRMCDRDQLARARTEHVSRSGSRRRAAMFERRMRYWDHCKAQCDRCDEELAVMADMIRLLAQKAICPPALGDDDMVERVIEELDEEEHALRQLSMFGG